MTDALRSRRNKIEDLGERLTRIRARGFLFKASLEGQLSGAAERAPHALEEVLRESRELAERLEDRVDRLGDRARRLLSDRDLGDRKDEIEVLEGDKRDLDGEVRDAKNRLSAISDPVVKAVDSVDKGVRDAEGVIEAFDEGGFDLEPGEHPVAVVGATWEDAPGEPQTGKLMFTDARVRFVQDEVKKSGGFLGFGATKTHVKKLQIDEPIGRLASSDDSTRGWVFKDQVLGFKWTQEARHKTTTFEVDSGSAETWDALVEALRDGSIATDRVEGVEGVQDEVLTFPTQCTACQAALPAAVKGQRTLECPYCSTVVNPL